MDLEAFKTFYQRKEVEENDNNVAKQPVVSVCIQTYQHAGYIKECLDSIITQKTNFKFEVLLGEDASTDGTREICIDYAECYPDKIRLLLHQRENNIKINGKPTGRFNFLYNLYTAKGKYIALCEGDDYWTDPYKLQKQIDFLEKHDNFSMCFTLQLLVSKTGEILKKEKSANKSFSTYDVVKGFIPGTQTMVFRNHENLVQLISKFSTSPSGDRILAYCCSLFGDLYLLPEFTAAYRQTGNGVWTSINKEDAYFLALEEFIKFHISIGLPVNNEFVYDRVNGAYPYLFKKDRRRFFININRVKEIKRKYKIKSSPINYIFSNILSKIF